MKAEFEKTCECTLTFVGLDSVGILGRIQLKARLHVLMLRLVWIQA